MTLGRAVDVESGGYKSNSKCDRIGKKKKQRQIKKGKGQSCANPLFLRLDSHVTLFLLFFAVIQYRVNHLIQNSSNHLSARFANL